jgi:hypothetical protein
MKNIFLFLFVIFGISNAYSQYSNDPKSPLVVFFSKPDACNRGNLRIATLANGTTFIAGEYTGESLTSGGKYAGFISLHHLDADGNVISNKRICEYTSAYVENNFELTASNNRAVLSVILSKDSVLLCVIDDVGDITNPKLYFDSTTENPISYSISTDIRDSGEIVYAVPRMYNINVNKIKPSGEKMLEKDIVIEGYNAMPKVCFVEDGSFYVVYRVYDKLYVDFFDKDCGPVWKGVYVGHETGSNLSNKDPHYIIADGQGGIYVIWKNKNIFVQRIVSENDKVPMGVRKFDANGLALTEETIECYSPIMSFDKSTNELNIAWRTQNTNTNSVNLQKINSDGEKMWGTNGIIVDEGYLAYQNTPVAIGSTVEQRVLIIFSKYNTNTENYDLLFNRYFRNGEKMFDNHINFNISKSIRTSMVSTDYSNNQMVIAWCDSTETNQVRTLAQNISYNGILGTGAKEQSISNENLLLFYDYSIFPVPTNDNINIKINFEYNTKANIAIFDYLGRLFYTVDMELKAGENILNINESLPIGEYNVIINTPNGKINQAIIVN